MIHFWDYRGERAQVQKRDDYQAPKNQNLILNKIVRTPELNIIFFSFLLNFSWEVLATPFYLDQTVKIDTIIWNRLHCTGGDVMIALGCFWLVSLVFRTRASPLSLTKKRLLLFMALGVIYTVFSEMANVRLIESWGYSSLMPVIPYIRVGVVPLIQWIIVPPILILIVKRQLTYPS
jgi:hypothetical protein